MSEPFILPTPDLLMAQLFCDYLSHPASIAAGVPDAGTLPKLVMDSGIVPQLPSLVVAAREEKGSVGARRVIDVSVMLLTWLKAASQAADEVTQTTRTEASQWLCKIDARLQDRGALNAFLTGLDAERRKGWTIMKLLFNGNAVPMRVPESQKVHYATTLRVFLFMRPAQSL